MNVLDRVIQVLCDTLELDAGERSLCAETPLFESLPELDSLGVVRVVQALEGRFDIAIEGDEIGAETFETVGTLARFVAGKVAAPDQAMSPGTARVTASE